MQISEVFESIQGEGPWIGCPSTFIRLFGCNLTCSFCDSQYSRYGECTVMTPLQVLDRISMKNTPYVVFTGGEPCMQFEEMKQVILALRKRCPEKKVAIETNGTLEFDSTIFDAVVVSPKSMSVVSRWSNVPNVHMKFLASDENDIENIRRQMNSNVFANTPFIMPIGITSEQIVETSKLLSKSIVSKGLDIILSPRLHVLMGVK